MPLGGVRGLSPLEQRCGLGCAYPDSLDINESKDLKKDQSQRCNVSSTIQEKFIEVVLFFKPLLW